MFMCVKVCLCVCVCERSGCEDCVNLFQQIIWVLYVCVCASPYHIHTIHTLRVWCMKWRGTDTYLPRAGSRSLTTGLTRPSSSPVVFLWPPPSPSEALTHKPRKIYSTLAQLSACWLSNKVKQKWYFTSGEHFILSVITQVCPGIDGHSDKARLCWFKSWAWP